MITVSKCHWDPKKLTLMKHGMFSKKPLKELLLWEMCQERRGMIGSGTVQVQRDISSIYITIVCKRKLKGGHLITRHKISLFKTSYAHTRCRWGLGSSKYPVPHKEWWMGWVGLYPLVEQPETNSNLALCVREITCRPNRDRTETSFLEYLWQNSTTWSSGQHMPIGSQPAPSTG